jgi:phosphoribosylanthranilate isomerase
LDRYPYKTTFFLSGGIGPDQIKELKNIKDDRLYAIDLNSKFELEPGVKDTCKVNQAINDVRLIDTQ